MTNGMSFQVDMQSAEDPSTKCRCSAGGATDYPRSFQHFVSNDRTNFGTAVASWRPVPASTVTVEIPC